ncbi:high affinity Mn2+ porin [Bradyrhizobium sp. AZCC 2262]|uniref:carbohydrate porin n=1 Tax=Bradyrhizobium sp. AZCC 2262 TaxID=3117022 RepID=UPI002FEE6D3D
MKKTTLFIISAGVAWNWSPALAADPPLKVWASKKVYDWTGFYVGGHFGYGGGSFGPDTNPLPLQGVAFPHSPIGLIGGYQIGYNRELPNHVVLGVEADSTFPSYLDQSAMGRLPPAAFNTTLDYIGTVRGRIGYAFGPWMPYVTGGFAWGHTHAVINDGSGVGHYQPGWTAGIGLEFAVSGNWSAKLEYEYVDLSRQLYDLSGFGLGNVNVDSRISLAKIGLNYHFGDLTQKPASKQTALPDSDAWNVHAQMTFLPQGYPSIRAPYTGPNSLPGGGQLQATWTTTAFLGAQLWEGGEFYFNPELAQGFGINGTLGLAGFSNGEAQKAGAPFPKIRAQRYYIKQTWGLGGEQEEVADGPNQLSGKRDIDRITLIVGRFAVGDFFDNNAYAHDPRADFMNWAMWEAAAYDFPADLPGYTRGAVVELNRKDWAVRAGLLEVPSQPNSDILQFKTGGVVAEFEERHSIFGQPGKLRLGAFGTKGVTGNYNQALAITALDPTQDINAVMASIRRVNPKHGFYANLEQQIVPDIGLFARASWNDGQNEILSFTDIDRSLSGGLSIKGSFWGRPNDTVGIGGAINGLSAAHRNYLAAGGMGLLIGDGQLNYRPEQIVEAYYAWKVNTWSTLSFDYQFVANPSYNADRGPVSIFSARAHAEF